MSDEPRDVALPEENIIFMPEDAILPTELWSCDTYIAQLEDKLRAMIVRRERLLERAIALEIFKDEDHTIVVHEHNLPRAINVELATKLFPEEVEKAKTLQIEEAESRAKQAIDKAAENVNVGTLKKFLSDRMVDECSYPHEITRSYEVMTNQMKIALDKAKERKKNIAIASATKKTRK